MDLLSLSRNQLRIMTGLLTGLCHLKGQLFKLRLVDSPWCGICQQASEVAWHVLCDYEALAVLGTWTIVSRNQVIYWHLCEQGTALCWKCEAAECLGKALHKKIGNGRGTRITAGPSRPTVPCSISLGFLFSAITLEDVLGSLALWHESKTKMWAVSS